MNFNEYQAGALKTAAYPNIGENLTYTTLGLAGEAGEVANKVKKIQRDHGGVLTQDMKVAIIKELGDVLWYVAQCCHELHVSMDDVAAGNLAVLAIRQQLNKIHGSGDNR